MHVSVDWLTKLFAFFLHQFSHLLPKFQGLLITKIFSLFLENIWNESKKKLYVCDEGNLRFNNHINQSKHSSFTHAFTLTGVTILLLNGVLTMCCHWKWLFFVLVISVLLSRIIEFCPWKSWPFTQNEKKELQIWHENIPKKIHSDMKFSLHKSHTWFFFYLSP